MSRSNPEVFADHLLSLPRRVKSLREQAAALNIEADAAEASLEYLDRSRLDRLKLTGNLKLDAALRLSMESGGYGGKYWLEKFPGILEKIEHMEKDLAEWKEGGIMLADFTSQIAPPLCFEFVVLEVPPQPALQIVATRGYFHDIPISIQVPARLLMAQNSQTWIMGLGDCIDLASEPYEMSQDQLKVEMVNLGQRGAIPTTITFDVTKLFHPNWGTRNVPLAGIVLGEPAIARHIDKWKAHVNKGYCMGSSEIESRLEFLDEFLGTVRDLARIPA